MIKIKISYDTPGELERIMRLLAVLVTVSGC